MHSNGKRPRRAYPWRKQFYQEELVHIRELNPAEAGVFDILTLLAWQKGGELPADTKRLAAMARWPHRVVESAVKRLDELELISLRNGSLRFHHIDRELERASKRTTSAVGAARRRWGTATMEEAR